MQIVTAPSPILSQQAKPVSKIDEGIRKLIEEMKKKLAKTTDPKGVGLAAPQIGKPLRIFIAKPTEKAKVLVFINPQIIEQSSEVEYVKRPARQASQPRLPKTGTVGQVAGVAGRPKKDTSKKASKKLEGCLSLPTIWGSVLRSSSLTLSYFDEHGKSHTKKYSHFMATIVQHEMDHLNGVLFPKRVLEQKGKLYKSHKNEKGEDEFEEMEL